MTPLPLLVSFPNADTSLDIVATQLSWSADQRTRASRFHSRGLAPLIDTRTLPFLFGVSHQLISAMGKFSNKHYRTYTIPKKHGGERRIEAPRTFLKVIQRWILEYVLSRKDLPEVVNGFVRGKSIFDNANSHIDGKNLLVVDIKDFFPSVGANSVNKVFTSLRYSEPVSKQLTALTTLDGRLPQGAPTSPALANLAFVSSDRALERLAKSWGVIYSRYADDLAFSGSRRFSLRDAKRVGTILGKGGFQVNSEKTRIIGGGGQQIVAGLVVNARAQPPRYKRRIWRAMFHRASKHPREFDERVGTLTGIASFINQYDPELSQEYRQVAETIAATKRNRS